jgi:molybdate-binding protein/DNA-binding transcriptional regulator YhcF (GntR family)
MEETFIYQQIAESIRRDIIEGKLKPGDRLPSIREMTQIWNCTVGTVQRAYKELADKGLVMSHSGKGTHIVERLPSQPASPMRIASLYNRADSFLLEAITAGYSPEEIEQAISLALDRWRAYEKPAVQHASHEIHFYGSHDLAVKWLSDHFERIIPGYTLQIHFVGSLGGLIAMAQGDADLAGCHLWDPETRSYNETYIRKILPNRPISIITLAQRHLGFILPPGNPLNIKTMHDLTKPGIRFINRQNGSGTRVWLDAQLSSLHIDPEQIDGYTKEKLTHSEVARAIIEGEANVGLGLEAAAAAFGLDFVFLTQETYDLVVKKTDETSIWIDPLALFLKKAETKQEIESLGGYDCSQSGMVKRIS